MLVGLNSSGNKGVLLFGKIAFNLEQRVTNSQESSAIYLVQTFGSALSIIYAYNASNTSGHTKKLTVNAMTLVAFAVGNIAGTEIFQTKDAPDYIPGKVAILVLLSVQLVICFLLRFINLRLNNQRARKLTEEKARHGWSDADVQRERERHAFVDLTDKQYVSFTLHDPSGTKYPITQKSILHLHQLMVHLSLLERTTKYVYLQI